MAVQTDIAQQAAGTAVTLGGLTLPVWRRFWLVAFLVAVVVVPFVVEDFTVFQFTLAAIYAIAVLGLNLLTGFNGQFSLGHSAFYAVGAYTAAIMMDQWQVAYFWTLIPAFVVALVVGFLFGLPALRLEGLYLALATFALAVATPQLFRWGPVEHWTGGVQGIDLDKPETPFGLPLNDDQWIYFFTLGVMAVLFVGAWNLVRGRSGRAIIAIRDNPIAARTMGINTSLYKSLTFGVSAGYTGVAGALSAIVIQFVAPDSFTFILAVLILVGVVVGGLGSIPFAIFGGLFMLYVPNFSEELLGKSYTWAVYGTFLILAVYVMPTGAAGLVRIVTARVLRAVGRNG